MLKLKEIQSYEAILFGVYIFLGSVLRFVGAHVHTIIGTILIIIHPSIVLKFHGKIITCFTGVIAGGAMIYESIVNGNVSNDVFLFILMYRLLGIVFVVYYMIYGYFILKGNLKNN